MPGTFSRRHGVTALPGDQVAAMLSDMRRRLAGLGLAEAEDLVARAEALARLGKVAQAAELLKQAAVAVGEAGR
jgi:ribosomal protein L7/L12